MTNQLFSRRLFLESTAGLGATFGLAGMFGAIRPAFGALAKPAAPVTLDIIDVAGNLALTQTAIENYRKAKPDWASKITFSKAPAPELPGKLKAQQDANQVGIDLVLTGTDVLSAGIDQKLWEKLVPDHAADLPDLKSIFLEPAWRMQGLAEVKAFSSPITRRGRSSNMRRNGLKPCRRRPPSCWPGPRPIPNASFTRGRPTPGQDGPS